MNALNDCNLDIDLRNPEIRRQQESLAAFHRQERAAERSRRAERFARHNREQFTGLCAGRPGAGRLSRAARTISDLAGFGVVLIGGALALCLVAPSLVGGICFLALAAWGWLLPVLGGSPVLALLTLVLMATLAGLALAVRWDYRKGGGL